MCVPIAMALVAASAVTSMAGQYVQGQAAYTNAKYQEAAADANAALASQQAGQSIELTQKEAQRRYREAGNLEGQQQAAMAANGIDINYGSAVDVARDSKTIANEDVGNIYEGGQNRTMGYLMDAYNYRLKSSAASSAASSAGLATGFSMLGTALGAASQINGMAAKAKSPSFGG
jgi:hypothetical protein